MLKIFLQTYGWPMKLRDSGTQEGSKRVKNNNALQLDLCNNKG